MGQGHAGVDPNGKSITTKTFQAAADSQGMGDEEAKRNTLKLLQKVLKDNGAQS
jgi:hypothetical protein